jgi:hypothetical protein
MQRFSFLPSKPAKGSNYLVCFDFSGLPPEFTYATVEVTHEPPQPDDPESRVIFLPDSGSVGCITMQAPSGCDAAVYTEPNSDDAAVVFT